MSNAGSITIPDIKIYCVAITIKITWYWHKTDMSQGHRVEDLDIDPHS
jgi:hypothetical protein